MIELDGGRVYLDDAGELFALPAHAAIRDRFVDALNASGAQPRILAAAAAPPRHPEYGREGDRATWAAAAIVNRPKYTARDWDVPAGSVA